MSWPSVDLGGRSRYLGQAKVITSHSELWGVITYFCLIYLLLAPTSTYVRQWSSDKSYHQPTAWCLVPAPWQGGFAPYKIDCNYSVILTHWSRNKMVHIWQSSFSSTFCGENDKSPCSRKHLCICMWLCMCIYIRMYVCLCMHVNLILDSSIGLWVGIQSADDLVTQTSKIRILHSAEEDNLSPFNSKSLPCAMVQSKSNYKNVCLHVCMCVTIRRYYTMKLRKNIQNASTSSGFVLNALLTHPGWAAHVCVSKADDHWFWQWFVTCWDLNQMADNLQMTLKIHFREWKSLPFDWNFI